MFVGEKMMSRQSEDSEFTCVAGAADSLHIKAEDEKGSATLLVNSASPKSSLFDSHRGIGLVTHIEVDHIEVDHVSEKVCVECLSSACWA